MDFLVYMEVASLGTGEDASKLLALEADRAKQLAADGLMLRLWRVPGRRANWGIWRAHNVDQLHEAISSLPLFPYLSVTVHPLATHPNDPGLPLNISG